MGLVRILKGISNGNVTCKHGNYNRNHSRGGRSIGIIIGNGILYGFGIDNGGICYMNFTLFWKR